MANLGLRVIVLTAQRGVVHTRIERHDDCWVVTFPAWPIASMSVSPRLVWAAIRGRRSDHLMHVHGYRGTTVLALLGRRTPIVFSPHYDLEPEQSRSGHLRRALQRGLIKMVVSRCGAIICHSESERRTLVEEVPAAASRITLIPRGIKVAPIRSAERFADEPATVLCVGYLEPDEHVDDVVRAFAGVGAGTQLVIVGDGTQRDELIALASSLGLQARVRLVGNVGDDELDRWFQTAQVYVSMSRHEAIGTAPVQAAVAGARVIVSDTPAHREMADDFLRRCGSVLTDVSPAAISAEIQRQLLAPPGRCDAPDWRDVAARTVDVYRSAGAHLGVYATTNGHRRLAESLLHGGWGYE